MEKKFVEINLNENAYGMPCHDGCQRGELFVVEIYSKRKHE